MTNKNWNKDRNKDRRKDGRKDRRKAAACIFAAAALFLSACGGGNAGNAADTVKETSAAAAPGTSETGKEPAAETSAAKVQAPVFDFETVDVNGAPVKTLDIFKENEITMVNIWASWCGPCVGEIPELEEMNGRLKEKNCAIIGVLTDGSDPEGLKDGLEIMKENGVTYTNIVYTQEMDDLLHVQAVPTTIFVDREGNILGKPIIGAAVNQYEPVIDAFLKTMGKQ